MNSIIECPKCRTQIQLKASFASGPKSSSESTESADASDLSQLLSAIDEDALSGGEREFVEKTKGRFDQYGKNTRMSEKQMKWLRDIADKAGF